MNSKEDTIFKRKGVLLLERIAALGKLTDIDAILDAILYEARQFSNADAGSIFLAKGGKLDFSYVHNDTLFSEDETNLMLYDDYSIPINDRSIVGYVALTGKSLIIDNVYKISSRLPYVFNSTYDHTSGYKTKSILTIPLQTFQNKLGGVIQLINAKDKEGRYIPFLEEVTEYMPLLSSYAGNMIERGMIQRELVLRMVKMAELKDPFETGAHVQRVGSYSSEIYQKWAINKGINRKKIKYIKGLVRLASMLHDVGKIGITDFILKKPGKLTEKEITVMQWHTVFGARLFIHETSEIDKISCEIALNHHEKWDGTGYPGRILSINSQKIEKGKPKKGEDIPISARITALADVFDALSSRRSYKDIWSEDRVLDYIRGESGKQFDPEVIQAFFQIYPIIKAIQNKFGD